MRTWLANKLDMFRTNFLFFPLLMSALAVIVCMGLAYLDRGLDMPERGAARWLRAGSAEGVRSLLTAVVGALMTALSIVFSVTIVALTLAASQLGPRLLRNFMRDRTNQLILGAFISTFLYCLLTLRLVGATDVPEDLPHVTVMGAFLLSVIAFGVLVYFIHHVAQSIQAPNVITAVCSELDTEIERMFPETVGEAGAQQEGACDDDLPACQSEVTSDWDGYLQAIDAGGLLKIAEERDVILKVLRRPGHFLVAGETVVEVLAPTEVEVEMDLAAREIRGALAWGKMRSDSLTWSRIATEAIRPSLILGTRRTATQDIEFVMLQLVEIAVRALSPGINDPFTAMTCVDRLSAALCRLAGRHMPPARLYDGHENLRVILDRTDFQGLCNAAFDQIRQHAHHSAAVTIRLLEGLHRIAKQVRTDRQAAAVWRQAQMVHRAARELPEPLDRQSARDRFLALKDELGAELTDRQGQADLWRSVAERNPGGYD